MIAVAELYLQELRDLLWDGSNAERPKLKVYKDINEMVRIENATEVTVTSAAAANELLSRGLQRRHVSGTAMNAQSSRSHLIFSVMVKQAASSLRGKELVGKISLVDLAGSERVNRSQVSGEAFKEAVAINKSLSALLDVIDSLAKKERKGAQKSKVGVPYRNHILTQLMQDSLGGNAKTLMFVNISPADSNIEETRGALGYASRASTIRNAVGNATGRAASGKEVEELKAVVKKLKMELAAALNAPAADDAAQSMRVVNKAIGRKISAKQLQVIANA